MKTLYISDLDGTLLNKNAELSAFTKDTLNSLIEKGMFFSAATARTHATVTKMLENVNIGIPVILMNGVASYNLQSKLYVSTEDICEKGKKELFGVIKNHLKSGFIYIIENGELDAAYENTSTPNAADFIKERQEKYGKKFIKVNSFYECINRNVVYYSINDKKEKLQTAYDILKQSPYLRAEFYRDIYNENHWYLEVCSSTASKMNAVNKLKTEFGFDRVISFGDNLNDLPMFRISDEAYAVENAKEEVKKAATGIIESNQNDGVAKFLLKKLYNK